MRITVLSDSHGAFSSLEKTVSDRLDDTSLFIFLGDGHRDIEKLVSLYPSINLLAVSGNCDFCSSYPVSNEIKFNGKRIFFTHGHLFNVKYSYDDIIAHAENISADLLLFGHTHTPFTEYSNGLYIMNPGSLRCNTSGLPSYGIIDVLQSGISMNIVNL